MMGLGSGTPGRWRGTRTRRAAGCDGAAHRGVQHQRLPIDPDRDLGDIGVDDHLPAGQADQPPRAAPAQQPGRLGGALDGDREHPQGAPVQPGPTPQPGDITHPIGVVGDQDRLGALDGHVLGGGHQPRPPLAGQQPGQLIQGRVRALSSRYAGLCTITA